MSHHADWSCAVCGGSLAVQRHSWLWRCGGCGFLASTLDVRINAVDSHLDESLRADALRPLRSSTFSAVLDTLAEAGAPAPGRILDVGSAHGWFLQQAAERGYDAVGIEPDHDMAQYAAARGANVRTGYFPDLLERDERFDAIVFNDVFEHLPDVTAAILAVRAHLAPGGLLVVTLPLATGTFYRLAELLDRFGFGAPFERMWQMQFASPHRSYFAVSTMTRLGENHGFALAVSKTLPSFRIRGLWERLRYDKNSSALVSAAMWPALVAAAPLFRLLPQDIGLFAFRLGDRDHG